MFNMQNHRTRGMTLVEVLVASALMLVVFGALFTVFQYTLAVSSQTRAQAGAVGIANKYLEYMHGLPYDSVGTVAGIPAGLIPQNSTVDLNGISYNRRVLVQYVDDPSDGSGVADSNGIAADYKRAKVEVSWTIKGVPHEVALITNLIPPGIETLAGGGTLVVNVFDAVAAPVDGAAVRIVNNTTTSTIDVTSYTNIAGITMFPGAPASGGYEVSATAVGYSVDQTYSASTSNPNPNPPHVAVVANGVSTVNLGIDRVSTLAVKTVEPPTEQTTSRLFPDMTGTVSSSSVEALGGDLVLTNVLGVYAAEGSATSTVVEPAASSLLSWERAEWSEVLNPQTQTAYYIYAVDGSGAYTLIPDSDLPGNSAGLTVSPVDLATLPVATYPRLAIGAVLQSLDGSATPQVHEWRFSYMMANVPIPDITFTLEGTKNIGTDTFGVPVLKYSKTHTTNASGVVQINNLEWDQYDISINGQAEGYDISDACPVTPFALSPGVAATTTLILEPHTTHSLRVHVRTAVGASIPGATVRVHAGVFDKTETSSACGQTFFSGMSNAVGYTVDVSAPGYTSYSLSPLSVSGMQQNVIVLTP